MSIYANMKHDRRFLRGKRYLKAADELYESNPDEVLPSDAFALVDLDDGEEVVDDIGLRIDIKLDQIAASLREMTELIDDAPENVCLDVYRDNNFCGSTLNPMCLSAIAAAYYYWQRSANDKLELSFDSDYHLKQVLGNIIGCAFHYWTKGGREHDDVLDKLFSIAPFYSNEMNSEFTLAATAAYCAGFYDWKSFNQPKYDGKGSRYNIVSEVGSYKGKCTPQCSFCGRDVYHGSLMHARNQFKYLLGRDDARMYDTDELPLMQDVYICKGCAEQASQQLAEHEKRTTKQK